MLGCSPWIDKTIGICHVECVYLGMLGHMTYNRSVFRGRMGRFMNVIDRFTVVKIFFPSSMILNSNNWRCNQMKISFLKIKQLNKMFQNNITSPKKANLYYVSRVSATIFIDSQATLHIRNHKCADCLLISAWRLSLAIRQGQASYMTWWYTGPCFASILFVFVR